MERGKSAIAGPLAAGTRLQGRYEIVRVLGFGGVSTVYLAIDRRFTVTERRCAVKEMIDAIADPTLRELSLQNFEREANVLASLNHVAVPKIFDYFQQHGRLYLVEELIDGEDLAYIQARTDGPLPVEKVVDWALQILDVLEYLHNHKPDPIVFRDLKPSNVMLNTAGRIILIDFGIAKSFTGHVKGTMIGTDGYAAPEQYRGIADPRTDIYGLGATLHHLLTGSDPREHPPFSWRERPVDSLNPRVPRQLSDAIGRALEYHPDQRFQSVAEFRRALQASAQGLVRGSAILNAPNGPQPPQPARTPSGRLQTTKGLLARLPATSGPLTLPTDTVRAETAAALAALAEVAAPAPPDGVPDGGAEGPIVGPVKLLWRCKLGDEVRGTATGAGDLVYVGCYDGHLYCLNLSGDVVWRYATRAGICATPLLRGDSIYIGSEDGHLYALNARTGSLIWSHKTVAPVRSSAGADGDLVVVGADDGNVYAFDARNGQPRWSFQAWQKVRSTPLVREGGVYFGSHDGTFYCLDADTGRVRWKYDVGQPIMSSPTTAEGNVYFGAMDGSVTALELRTGWLTWRHRTDGVVVSSPTVAHGRVYIGSVDQALWALDAMTGRVAWTFRTGGQVTSSPRVGGERIYVGGVDHWVYCLDRGGKLVWKFRTGGAVPASPLLLDGRVIIGSCDQHLYALRG